jgi:hypothetical protein
VNVPCVVACIDGRSRRLSARVLHCPKCTDDQELYTRVLSMSRVVCTGGGTFLLKRLLHNASVQQTFFTQPVVTQGGLELMHSRLSDAASMLRDRFCASGLSVDSRTGRNCCRAGSCAAS